MAEDKSNKPELPPLDSEAATRQQDPHSSGFMGQVLTNDPLLVERGEQGPMAFELYRDLKRDGKVFAGLQKRKLAVVSREWTVTPQVATPEGERDAKIVTDILGGFAFDRLCAGLLDALVIGWQPVEVVWTLREVALEGGGSRQMVVPDRVPKRLQRRFIYKDTEDGQPPELRLLTRSAMQDGVPVHPRKFIVHTVEADDDNPYGLGLGLQLYWPVFFKRKGVLSWNKLCDRFGTPTPWGKYPRDATPREKGTLFDALRAFSNDGMLMTPEGTMIELLEARMAATGVTPNQSLVEYMDDWIMEVLLGQPPRKGGGGALAAAAGERQDVRLELSQADSDLLSETLNRTLLRWICEYNGLQPCLVSRKVQAEEDTKALAEADKAVFEMGFKPTADRVRERFGEGWEEKSEPAAPAPGVTHAGFHNGHPDAEQEKKSPTDFAEGSPDVDAIDRLVAAELGHYAAVIDPMTAPVHALLERAAADGLSAAQVLAQLPDVLASMDTGALQSALTSQAYAANLAAQAGAAKD